MSQPSQSFLTETFNTKTESPKHRKSAKTSPLCIRITDRERERLERDAGDLPLSAYVRSRLFDAAVIAPRLRDEFMRRAQLQQEIQRDPTRRPERDHGLEW